MLVILRTQYSLNLLNDAEYTMTCIQYIVQGIVLEISNKIAKKNPTQRNSERKSITMSRKNKSRQWATGTIILVDESMDAVELSTLVVQVKYTLILIVNVQKQPD